ncbi:predicted protein [Postia placenta Mad-698-R]|nr:predicted protein [Postia placenta Mad-698-R]
MYTALLNTAFMILGLHSWPSWQSERYSPLFYTFIINEPILVTFPRLTCGLHTQGKYVQLYTKLIQGARGSSLLFDLVVLIITWTKLRAAAMDIRSQARVSVVLIRDTTFYFSLQRIVNILGISRGSVTVSYFSLTSSLLSRLLFDLRKVAAEGLGVSLTHSMTLAFAGPDLFVFEDDVTSDRHLDAEAI